MKKEHNTKEYSEKLSDKILSKIAEENITPIPRWHFMLKEDTLWVAWFLSLLVGSLGVAGALYTFKNAGWEYYSVTHNNVLSFVVDAMPFFWILSLVIFVLIGYVNIRYTKKGYRYPFVVILGSSVLASVAIGSLLFVAGAGNIIDRLISPRIPFHKTVEQSQQEKWLRPQIGLVAGDVLSVSTSSREFYLKSFDAQVWKISTDELTEKDWVVLQNVGTVRVAGNLSHIAQSTTTKGFEACFVFPWQKVDLSKKVISEGMLPEIKEVDMRTSKCRGVRPYDSLQKIRSNLHLQLGNEKITR